MMGCSVLARRGARDSGELQMARDLGAGERGRKAAEPAGRRATSRQREHGGLANAKYDDGTCARQHAALHNTTVHSLGYGDLDDQPGLLIVVLPPQRQRVGLCEHKRQLSSWLGVGDEHTLGVEADDAGGRQRLHGGTATICVGTVEAPHFYGPIRLVLALGLPN